MSAIRIGINGFGRIGRRLYRLLLECDDIEVVAINDVADPATLAHLLKYDSIHGVLSQDVQYHNGLLLVGDQQTVMTQAHQPAEITWPQLDIVVESSGRFKDKASLDGHLIESSHRVILSVPPAEDDIPMLIRGVNDRLIPTDRIISNASCTTHSAAPMVEVIDRLCGIEQCYITTVHSYTTDQSLHDQPHRDLRRARAAAQSMVPTTTGAAKALTRIFPQYAQVIGGCGIRVPIANGSLTDITFNVQKGVSIEAVNEAFKRASESWLKDVLEYTQDPIVSVDVIGNRHSCVFDSGMTSVIGRMVKVIGWYDNETGYSSRIIDLIRYLSSK
ncbi:type I glyceraldehyde-3-phosphate dehydrogenase [Aureitalea marina]|uniref:Type I glyceraldehyde-3-phosphate dehydrogenase n=1 Tax=Aureitalea marina TaxID=930804 RepID=A0A2S7KMD9_9FLAO|nr:glyceraldehyde 3-phosphate dehydrogenase NAD-binding domain-containing protein [Aureitalea marina]PQB03761.1 type I glyceraldehyde-3-phosphate dehydrogenase [Aureitalea marina]